MREQNDIDNKKIKIKRPTYITSLFETIKKCLILCCTQKKKKMQNHIVSVTLSASSFVEESINRQRQK